MHGLMTQEHKAGARVVDDARRYQGLSPENEAPDAPLNVKSQVARSRVPSRPVVS